MAKDASQQMPLNGATCHKDIKHHFCSRFFNREQMYISLENYQLNLELLKGGVQEESLKEGSKGNLGTFFIHTSV